MRKYFCGRPDGLGNRLEEVIILEAMCLKYGYSIDYGWNNQSDRHDRLYDILFDTKLLNITPAKSTKLSEIELPPRNDFSQEDILSAAKNITPKFDITFDNNIKPIGVHIRGTDRINKDATVSSHFMKDKNELNAFLSKTIELINKELPSHVFICSDDETIKNRFSSFIDKRIKIVTPKYDRQSIPSEYADLFSLSLCRNIYMASKFSTFSILASLIGQIPIISFTLDDVIKDRYKALFEYNLEPVNKSLNITKERSKLEKLIYKVKDKLHF